MNSYNHFITGNFYQRLKQFILFILLLLFGCNQSNVLNRNIVSFSKFSVEDTLSFRNIYEYTGGEAGILELVDSVLILFNVNEGTDYFINNYSIKTGRVYKEYFKSGKGPGEVIGAFIIGINRNSLWLYDVTSRKIITTDLRKAIANNTTVSYNEYAVKDDYLRIGFKDSLRFFAAGFDSSIYKIQEVDLISGNKVNEFGKIESIPDDMTLNAYKAAHECFIHVKPACDKIVLSYRFTDAIEIYDIKTQKSIMVHGPDGFNAEGKPNGSSWYRTDKTRFAFVSGGGTVTNQYIYMLYSGDLWKDRNSRYAKCIFVYDWDGNPIRKLVLNRQIQGIAVSEDDITMYAFDVNTGYLIQSKSLSEFTK